MPLAFVHHRDNLAVSISKAGRGNGNFDHLKGLSESTVNFD